MQTKPELVPVGGVPLPAKLLQVYSLGRETNRPLAGPDPRRPTPLGQACTSAGEQGSPARA
jgi:hypothetical protein